MTGFRKKDLDFFEIAKIGKYVVEYDWKSKISQSAQNIIFLEKRLIFSRKKTLKLLKLQKAAKLL